jgi:hypothetical protein
MEKLDGGGQTGVGRTSGEEGGPADDRLCMKGSKRRNANEAFNIRACQLNVSSKYSGHRNIRPRENKHRFSK